MNKSWMGLVLGIIVVLTATGVIYGMVNVIALQPVIKQEKQDIDNQVEESGLTVVVASFDNSVITVKAENITVLIQKAKMFNQTEIYKIDHYEYAVVENEMTVWNYTYAPEDYRYFMLTFISAVFLALASIFFITELTVDYSEPW